MSLRKNREQVLRFREVYQDYVELEKVPYRSPEEDEQMQALRSEINRATPLIISLFRSVGEPTTIYYSPPPMVGGVAGRFDLLQNLFNPVLRVQGIDGNVFDMLDKGIGRYDYLIANGWKKWINPIHWIGELIRVPFYILRFSGFDANKIELSIFGRIYKLFAGLVAFVAGLIKIYQFAKPILQAKGINLP